MDAHVPNDNPQNQSNRFDDLADHTNCGIDENYNSDFEEDEIDRFKPDLDSEEKTRLWKPSIGLKKQGDDVESVLKFMKQSSLITGI